MLGHSTRDDRIYRFYDLRSRPLLACFTTQENRKGSKGSTEGRGIHVPSSIWRPRWRLCIFTVREIIVKGLYRPRPWEFDFMSVPIRDRPSLVTRWFLLSLTRAVRTCFYSPAYDGLVLRRNIVILVSYPCVLAVIKVIIFADFKADGTNQRENTEILGPCIVNASLSRCS